MPGMDGIGFARQIRTINKKIRKKFISAYEKDDQLESSLHSLHTDAFLQKPYSLVSLYNTINVQNKGNNLGSIVFL